MTVNKRSGKPRGSDAVANADIRKGNGTMIVDAAKGSASVNCKPRQRNTASKGSTGRLVASGLLLGAGIGYVVAFHPDQLPTLDMLLSPSAWGLPVIR